MWGRLVVLIWHLTHAFSRRRIDDETRCEFQQHFDLLVDRYLRRGMTRAEAHAAARRQFGNELSIREEIDQMNALPFLETLWQDLRYGVRILRRNPTFSLVAIFTLALGTGANLAIFQLVNTLRLRSLPVEKPYELLSIRIDQHGKGRVGRGYAGAFFTEPLWQEMRSQQQGFSSLLAWGNARWDLSSEGEVVLSQGLFVSGGFFDALGVHARAGRLLTEADDRKDCRSPGAILSHAFWLARFAGNPAVIGQKIMLDRHPFDVIGVAPPGFFGVDVGRAFEVALPLCAEPLLRGEQAGTGQRAVWWLDIMGRLEPGWTVERAHAHLASLSPILFGATVPASYNADWAKNYAAFTLTASAATTGISTLRAAYASQLWVLFGATGMVLFLACANLANLMLARSTARAREIAVRLAIGASRRRVIRQMLSESALIAGFGASAGLLLGRWISHGLVLFLNASNNRIFLDLSPDWRLFALVTVSAALACLMFGVSPALRATRCDPAASIQPGSRSSTDAHEAVALRRGLVIVQVAISMVLVVGAVLFGRTLSNLASVELGFDPDVVAASVDLRRTAVRPEARTQVFADIVARLQQVPGVRRAAETMIVPLSGSNWNGQIVKNGVVQDGDVYFNQIGGNYFQVMGTPLISGRTFDGRDRADATKTAVVNQAFVRRYFQNIDPIGQTFQVDVPREPKPTLQIVGVVGDTKLLGVREERTPARVRFSAGDSSALFLPIVYLPVSQAPTPPSDFRFVVRADLPAAVLTRALTAAITEIAPGAAVAYDEVGTYIDRLLVTERLMAWLSGFFGLLAMLIAAIGLYGVMSYTVTRRRVEIGIRLALGADPRDVVRMVLGESAALLASGIVVGVGLAVASSRYAASLLYGLTPLDATSFALGIGATALVSFVAAWIPARRASSVAPTIALRE